MSAERDLLRLAREREKGTNSALTKLLLESPDHLLRQLRADLARQVDYGRRKHAEEKIVTLTDKELACKEAGFTSGSRLSFNIQFEQEQRGWLVERFRFHLHLPAGRSIGMVRIHLNRESWHDPLTIPRCHMHIDKSKAHIPFPIMHPRLILHHICEHIESDFGLIAAQ